LQQGENIMPQRRVRYFNADGVEVSEQVATRNGILRDQFSLRVPTVFRDSHFRDARELWDADNLRVTDARAIGGVEGCKPGFRVLDNDLGRQAIADARAAYIFDLENAWRTPPRDAAPAGSYPLTTAAVGTATGEGERGARGSQEGDLCMCSGPDDEGPQGAAGHLVRRDGDLVCRADEQYSEADSMTVDAMNAAHVRNMQRIYDQIAIDLSQQWREGK
jgi:hypothetical protein